MGSAREKTCADCGVVFIAARSDAKFCSATCRSRARNKNPAATAPEPGSPQAPTPVPPAGACPTCGRQAPDPAAPVPDPELVAAVKAELAAVGKLEARQGQQAVVMARKLAHADTTPSSVASLSKTLDELMDRLVGQQGGSGPAAPGRRGTLATRRQAKRGAAA